MSYFQHGRRGRGTFHDSYRGRGIRGGRGGGGGGRGSTAAAAPSQLPLPAPSFEQKRFQEISHEQIPTHDIGQDSAFRITNCQYVASYNWVDKNNATILVPGMPPKWTPPKTTSSLKRDQGIFYRDQNTLRCPRYPTNPAIQTVLEVCPKLDTSAIDLFACGSTLGSLLHFAANEDYTFRFGVEHIGNTVFLVRKTNTLNEEIPDIQGYGNSFIDTYTTGDATTKGSISSQRLIRYEINGLTCLVRFECDGFLPSLAPAVDSGEAPTKTPTCESLTSKLLATSIHSEKPAPVDKVSLQATGTIIPQQAIIEIKTRSSLKRATFDRAQFMPRQWIRQIPNLILAWHKMGTFDDVEINDVGKDIEEWEAKNIHTIRRLCSVMRKLIDLANEQSTKRFEVRRSGTGPLEFWTEVAGWSALSPDLKSRWKKNSSDFEHDGQDCENGDEDEDDGGVAVTAEPASSDSEDEAPDYLRF